MCLIAVIPARETREKIENRWLRDIYRRNNDGFGFMWMENRALYTLKDTGGVKRFLSAFREVESRSDGEFAVHTRMATHGAVSPEMAHPYPVDGPSLSNCSVVMMHNGVLAHGNYADVKKSDTWHYIDMYLRPLVSKFGTELLDDPAFQKLIGSDIGNNRFVFMAADGKIRIINRHQGLVWRGLWLSNTYAWDAEGFGAVKPRVRYTPVNGVVGQQIGSLTGTSSAKTNLRPLFPFDKGKEKDPWEWTPRPLTWQEELDRDEIITTGSIDGSKDEEDEDDAKSLGLDHVGMWLDRDSNGRLTLASLRREAADFLETLEILDYGDVAAALEINDVVAWIDTLGATEYVKTVNDIIDGTLDPHELFAMRHVA